MRLFVIGHFSKGKSTVLAALRKMKQIRTFDERANRYLDPDSHLTEDGTYILQSVVVIPHDTCIVHSVGGTSVKCVVHCSTCSASWTMFCIL